MDFFQDEVHWNKGSLRLHQKICCSCIPKLPVKKCFARLASSKFFKENLKIFALYSSKVQKTLKRKTKQKRFLKQAPKLQNYHDSINSSLQFQRFNKIKLCSRVDIAVAHSKMSVGSGVVSVLSDVFIIISTFFR